MPKGCGTNDIDWVMLYVNKQEQSPCWVWFGAETYRGYGKVTVDYKTLLVHRYVYEMLVGPIPQGMHVHHICNNQLCVNPAHLQIVTPQEHVHLTRPYKTHCKHGHELSGGNLYTTPDGRRQCKACRRATSKRHYYGGV
jgi:hypothetical protein